MLRSHIFQGKELTAADDTGMSDPYLQVRFGTAFKETSVIKETLYPRYTHQLNLDLDLDLDFRETHVIKETLYPRWYETVDFKMKLPTNQEMRPDINVLVFDEDDWGSDFLGRFIVPSKTVQQKYNPDPQWYDVICGDEDTGTKEGMILCSFQLMKFDSIEKVRVRVRVRVRGGIRVRVRVRFQLMKFDSIEKVPPPPYHPYNY